MRSPLSARPLLGWVGPLFAVLALASFARAGEPDPKSYWDVKDVRPGMKGVGSTVMVGTKLEQFEAEVLGVMRDVSPGRDMILCRLSGCDLEHAGIIQGMSGSPIYVEGKLLGAVAYAWEFAKDPIAGVTPFGQMVEYVRSTDRRLAVESRDEALTVSTPALDPSSLLLRGLEGGADGDPAASLFRPRPAASNALADMKPISMPLAASGFSPRALAALQNDLNPLGMAPMAAGGVHEDILQREGAKPLAPGSPLCVAMVTGDFDLSGIGTVTHVEGDRVYGFGHPMMGLGSCELPMMTGYIHTVYPRASVSMKMGSPMKVVGVIDTDVSTGISGRLGPGPDMLPMSVKVRTGRYAEPKVYNVQMVRHPKMLGSLVSSVLTSAVDTEGDLPDELTAKLVATIKLKDYEPIVLKDRVSGPRFSGQMGAGALFGPVSSLAGILTRNAIRPVRIESIDCEIEIDAGRTTAEVESVRLASDRVEPGKPLQVVATVKPFQGERQTVNVEVALPDDLPEGSYEVIVCDSNQSLRRRSNNQPHLSEPRTLEALLGYLRLQSELTRSTLFVHVPRPERGLAIQGEALPTLPASMRAVLTDGRQTTPSTVRDEIIQAVETSWVVEGSQTLKFQVARDAGLALAR